MNTTSTIQVSAGIFLTLLSLVPPPKPKTTLQMRRLAVCRGIRSFRRGDQCLPIKYARRSELIQLLNS